MNRFPELFKWLHECGPQSETYITINPASAKSLAAVSNEIFRDSMRGYFSSDGGSSWGAVDAQRTISTKTAVFDVGIPAGLFRRALVYPVCDADRSTGPHQGQSLLFVDGPDTGGRYAHFCFFF